MAYSELLTRWEAIPGMERVVITDAEPHMPALCGDSTAKLILMHLYVKDSAGVEREIDVLVDAVGVFDIVTPSHVNDWHLTYVADLAAQQMGLPLYLYDASTGRTRNVHPDYGLRQPATPTEAGASLVRRVASLPGVANVELLENPLETSETLVLCAMPGALQEELITHVPDSVIEDASLHDDLVASIAQEVAKHV
jgi:hypothetical protein